MVMIVTIVVWDNVVASKIDSMGPGNLEEYAFVLGNGDVQGLLVVLFHH